MPQAPNGYNSTRCAAQRVFAHRPRPESRHNSILKTLRHAGSFRGRPIDSFMICPKSTTTGHSRRNVRDAGLALRPKKAWFKWLRRRSQKNVLSGEKYNKLLERLSLPRPLSRLSCGGDNHETHQRRSRMVESPCPDLVRASGPVSPGATRQEPRHRPGVDSLPLLVPSFAQHHGRCGPPAQRPRGSGQAQRQHRDRVQALRAR